MKPKSHRIAFYLLLLAVYSVFFSVESFFNFEGQLNAREILSYSSFVKAPDNHPKIFKAMPLRSSSTHKVRLNKRFHKEDIAPVPMVFNVEAPVVRLIPRVLDYSGITPLPSVTMVHHPLRGPPVVA